MSLPLIKMISIIEELALNNNFFNHALLSIRMHNTLNTTT